MDPKDVVSRLEPPDAAPALPPPPAEPRYILLPGSAHDTQRVIADLAAEGRLEAGPGGRPMLDGALIALSGYSQEQLQAAERKRARKALALMRQRLPLAERRVEEHLDRHHCEGTLCGERSRLEAAAAE